MRRCCCKSSRQVESNVRPKINGFLDRRTLRTVFLFVTASLCATVTLPTRAQSEEQPVTPALQLVHEALAAELVGDKTRRASLLENAKQIAPEYGPARWHSGELHHHGAWMKVEDVQRQLSNDATWFEYERLRSQCGEGLADQIGLAEWCKRNGLEDEERFHWRKVLAMAPDHRRARGRLGVREYQGMLLTDEEIRELQRHEEKAKQAYATHEPVLKSLREQVTTRDFSERAAALASIAAIDDPSAIEAMCAILPIDEADKHRLARKLGSEGAETLALELELAIVAALGQMPQHQATLTLLQVAVLSSRPEVRAQAAERLKSRPKTDYVPLLMSMLTAPIEADIRVSTSRDGAVRLRKELFQAGPEVHSRLTVSNTAVTIVDGGNRNAFAIHNRKVAQDYGRAKLVASAARAQVDEANARISLRNERIQEVLELTTGMNYGNDVEAWWNAWETYNDVYYEETPVYEQSYSYADYDYTYLPPVSCFVAGTPVWTKAGLKRIEQIEPGDQVLSQNPATGELAYRFVVDTSVRPPTPVFRLTVDGQDILTTRGHRFWVNGRGWRMARFLEPGMDLHGIDGAAELTAAEEIGKYEVFNLVVDDFHTYFVGERRLLVHDNHCPIPVVGPLPGMPNTRPSSLAGVDSR